MSESVLDRLFMIPELEGISKNKFEASLGKSSGYLNVLKRNASLPGTDTLLQFIGSYPDYSLRWLLLGEGPMKADQEEKNAFLVEEMEMYLHPKGIDKLFKKMILAVLQEPEIKDAIEEIARKHSQ